MKRKDTGTENTGVKEPLQESRQTDSAPAEKKRAEKSPGWLIPACYVIWAALTILLTGLISLCLGMNDSLSGERGKIIVEILSSFLGSIYVAFLLGRWKEKEWKEKRTLREIKTGLLFGTALFTCRMAGRLVFSMFPAGARGAGYFTALMTDLICLIFLYSRMTLGRKEGSHA